MRFWSLAILPPHSSLPVLMNRMCGERSRPHTSATFSQPAPMPSLCGGLQPETMSKVNLSVLSCF